MFIEALNIDLSEKVGYKTLKNKSKVQNNLQLW